MDNSSSQVENNQTIYVPPTRRKYVAMLLILALTVVVLNFAVVIFDRSILRYELQNTQTSVSRLDHQLNFTEELLLRENFIEFDFNADSRGDKLVFVYTDEEKQIDYAQPVICNPEATSGTYCYVIASGSQPIVVPVTIVKTLPEGTLFSDGVNYTIYKFDFTDDRYLATELEEGVLGLDRDETTYSLL